MPVASKIRLGIRSTRRLGIFFSLVFLSVPSCKAPNASSAAGSPPQPAVPEEVAVGAESPEPQSKPVEAATQPQDAVAITPATRRTAAGLPEAIRGYQTWFRLTPGTGTATPPHLPSRQAYVSLPTIYKLSPGGELPIPVPEKTILVLEAKSPSSGFIEEVSVMEKSAEGWQFSSHFRSARAEAFAPAETKGCDSCHATSNATDGVLSGLKLR